MVRRDAVSSKWPVSSGSKAPGGRWRLDQPLDNLQSFASVAQWIERRIPNPSVASSILAGGAECIPSKPRLASRALTEECERLTLGVQNKSECNLNRLCRVVSIDKQHRDSL